MRIERLYNSHLLSAIKDLLSGYAAILFTQHPAVGLLFLLGTFWSPFVGLSGLLVATIALFTARVFRFYNLKSNQHLYSAILAGLSLGVTFEFNVHLIVLLLITGILVTLVTVAAVDYFWRFGRLPALSLPFVLVAFPVHFIAKGYATNGFPHLPTTTEPLFSPEFFNLFFTSVGATFFMPYPMIGFLFFLGILWSSRYLAFLALTGFGVGALVFNHFALSAPSHLLSWTGFNLILTPMAIGGFFTIPERRSFGMAMVGAALAALLIVAMEKILLQFGPLTFVFPFLLSTYIILLSLQQRYTITPPFLTLENPQLPETCYQEYRLIKSRKSPYQGSIALQPPFYGTWHIYQGFYGAHTHKPPWQHALDFFIMNGERSFKNEGTALEDYFCFGLPILAPCNGMVVQAQNHLPDNIPGEANLEHPLGNYLLIQREGGYFVLLAHLKQYSVQVAIADKVVVGQILAVCGNSGRSLQPHVHMQAQECPEAGSATSPFHLSAVVSQASLHQEPRFYPVLCPKQGASVQTVQKSLAIAHSLHFPAGRYFRFRFKSPKGSWVDRNLQVKLNLKGQFRLESDRGGSCFFEEHENLLIFHHKTGHPDPFFDIFLLSLATTPYAELIPRWEDAPSSHWLPLSFWQRFLLGFLKPLDPGLESQYRRNWDDVNKCWHQFGEHRLKLFLNWQVIFYTHVEFYLEQSFIRITGQLGKKTWVSELVTVGQVADEGIPNWEKNPISTNH